MHTDSLRADVDAIARPEGRMVGSPGHARARAYLERRLDALGLAPYRGEGFALSYRNQLAGKESHNLVGVIPGTDRRLPPLLIGAHYDSVIAAPSADDNAAAVAIALSSAAALGATPGRAISSSRCSMPRSRRTSWVATWARSASARARPTPGAFTPRS